MVFITTVLMLFVQSCHGLFLPGPSTVHNASNPMPSVLAVQQCCISTCQAPSCRCRRHPMLVVIVCTLDPPGIEPQRADPPGEGYRGTPITLRTCGKSSLILFLPFPDTLPGNLNLSPSVGQVPCAQFCQLIKSFTTSLQHTVADNNRAKAAKSGSRHVRHSLHLGMASEGARLHATFAI